MLVNRSGILLVHLLPTGMRQLLSDRRLPRRNLTVLKLFSREFARFHLKSQRRDRSKHSYKASYYLRSFIISRHAEGSTTHSLLVKAAQLTPTKKINEYKRLSSVTYQKQIVVESYLAIAILKMKLVA